MAFNGSDNLAISRAGTLYRVTGSDVLAYVRANMGSSEYRVADIAARNALTNLTPGDTVMVDSAVGDATVTAGWALYQYLTGGTWRKIAEQESLDISVGGATNLSYTPGAGSGVVVSDTGNDATIPAVTSTDAGLMLPAHKTKLDLLTATLAINLDTINTKVGFLTVTAATNLDNIRTAAAAAATSTAGSATTNPIVLAGNALSFSIDNLTSAP
jgi:hypothetical protein